MTTKVKIEQLLELLIENPQDGQVLLYDLATSKWKNSTIETSSFPSPLEFYADQFETPNSGDWAVNSLSPADVDEDNVAFVVRAFDDTTEEGVGFSLKVPVGATKMIVSFIGRAKTAPGAAAKVGLNLYYRSIPDNAAISAWSSVFALTDIDIPTNEYYQYDTQTINLGSGVGELNLTEGTEYQLELTRNPSATDDLSGDWYLRVMRVHFE